MARARKAPVVSLITLLAQRFPDLADPMGAVVDGRVVVEGSTVRNAAARVRRDSRVQVLTPRRLRGHTKLAAALDALHEDVDNAVVLDVGAAAGGFTSALLGRGARRVYALDAGFGQLVGHLRTDPRVINLERTNVAAVDATLIPDLVDLVTIDLSYLSVAAAVAQLERIQYASAARLLALVKPTFELGAPTLVTDVREARAAVVAAVDAIERQRWHATACTLPAVTGAHGAVEAFVLASRI
ncbi:MAG TPA: SAM-dependent methyltransferase [Acidimicrobiales bacterium]|nr:SAM-dependent methyltransferase [Acidimicrobiales bacterium]